MRPIGESHASPRLKPAALRIRPRFAAEFLFAKFAAIGKLDAPRFG
jgi:hypothetical protein